MVAILVAGLVFGIGISLGISGYGGFLVPAILISVLHMGPRDAVAHGLLSFILPGILGAYLYWRRARTPSWSITVWLCVGTVPGVLVGRALSGIVSERFLELLLAIVVLLAGVGLLMQRRLRPRRRVHQYRSSASIVSIVGGTGFLGGAASVLTGVGGPLITVPLLVAFGYEVTTLIGAAILNAVLVSVLAASSLLNVVTIQPALLITISILQLGGVAIGVWVQSKVHPERLITLISLASIVIGIGLVVKAYM